MDTSKANHEIVASGGYFFVHKDGAQLLSPRGNPLFLDSSELLEGLVEELKSDKGSGRTAVSLYNMCCTFVDHAHKLEKMPFKAFENFVLNDPVITAGDGPEKFHQVAKWTSYFEYLDQSGICHPDLSPSKEPKHLQVQIQERGPEYVAGVEKFMAHFYECFGKLNSRAKVAVMKATELYQAPIFGVLLSKSIISPTEFAEGVLAGMMILPEVRVDISQTKYQVYAAHIIKDAELLQDFAMR